MSCSIRALSPSREGKAAAACLKVHIVQAGLCQHVARLDVLDGMMNELNASDPVLDFIVVGQRQHDRGNS